MNKFHHSLRFKLFFWYIISLFLLAFSVILSVHIYQLPYANFILISAFILLSIIGFLIIYRFTKTLIYLSGKMQSITSKNLSERITIIKSKDEIGDLALTFNGLLDRLDIAFKRERQFIGDVAHEMKTPITTLRSSFEVTLQKERTNEEYKKIIIDSITETDKITNTLKNILELAWSKTPDDDKKEIFNLSHLIYELEDIAQKLSIKKRIKVTSMILPDIFVKGYRDRLGRAILNIIDNAIKYTPQNGLIKITLEKEKDQAIISIKDTGLGIEENEIERIFDRFYRGSKTKKVFGAGLGLAITKATIDIHKGKIKVISHPNKGSVFFIFIPLAQESS